MVYEELLLMILDDAKEVKLPLDTAGFYKIEAS